MLDVDKIRQLIEMMVANDLVEISLRDGDVEVNLRRPNAHAPVTTVVTAANPGPPVQTIAAAPSTPNPAPAPPADEDDADLVEITSPMVGTFYSAPDPESPPFVTVGSQVNPGTVTCILEAMKVFNEIKAEVSGRLTRVLVNNAEAVEYDQPLFAVEPL